VNRKILSYSRLGLYSMIIVAHNYELRFLLAVISGKNADVISCSLLFIAASNLLQKKSMFIILITAWRFLMPKLYSCDFNVDLCLMCL